MLALMFVLFLGGYALITLGVVRASIRWARKRGRRPWVWGGGAFLVMYHLVFWDLIPTAILYPYYQNREAGVWIYKTPEQWLEENPTYQKIQAPRDVREELGETETLQRSPERSITHYRSGFSVSIIETPLWPYIRRNEMIVRTPDKETIVARGVFFLSGDCSPQHPRFWVVRCYDAGTRASGDLHTFYKHVASFRDMEARQ